MKHLVLTLTLTSALFAAAGNAAAAPCATILEQPQPARVGLGAPVEFTVSAKLDVGATLLRYEWRQDGRSLGVRGSGSASHRMAAAALRDAGKFSVDIVTSCGTVSSQKALLEVVTGGWAMLTGRPLAGTAAAQAPSLALCNGTLLAWVERSNGHDALRVHRYGGHAWTRVGIGTLNTRTFSDAGEPSLQCSEFGGAQWPAVAFSESAALGRTIEVKRFDGGTWQAVGTPASTPGADARSPLLRLVPPNDSFTEQQHIQTRSALAWLEGTALRHQIWGAFAWGGVSPPSEVRGGHALAVDTAIRTLAGRPFPSLAAWIDDVDIGLFRDRAYPTLHSDLRQPWDEIGARPAAPAALDVPLRMVGVGFATEDSRPRVALVWSEGAPAYTLQSATMFSTDYEDAQFDPFNTNPWLPYALPYSGTGLQAIALDGSGQSGACYPTSGPISFTLALTDAANTRVMRADCRAGQPEWRMVEAALPIRADHLDLKMEDWQTPLVAAVQATAGGRRVAVWRYYR